MLRNLTIRDVVLIDKLDLAFSSGLSVLTGETGAGKSILLDALGLALGMRAGSGLVRHGQDKASVSALFHISASHPVHALLNAHDIATERTDIVLRRSLTHDGRSRAWINDQGVSVSLLRRTGAMLVEIQGQFDQQGLLQSGTHRDTLDAYGQLNRLCSLCRDSFTAWQQARHAVQHAEAAIETARADEAFLRHAVEELNALSPEAGEEARLAEERQFLMHGEKLRDAMASAEADLTKGKGAETLIRSAQRHLEREVSKAEGRFEPIIATLDRAGIELEESLSLLRRVSNEIGTDPRHQEQVEERLFALRAMARKHNTPVDGLGAVWEGFKTQLDALETGEENLSCLIEAQALARTAYLDAAKALSEARRNAAAQLDGTINPELPPLKMERARFTTEVTALAEPDWGADGLDHVRFMATTNPGTPPGPLDRIASGGELSRFLLALKLVLAKTSPIATLGFDEIDAGGGGATAAAIGERLHRLAAQTQLLAVTHSPQVAARGDTHFNIRKSVADDTTVTRVTPLCGVPRREEIARMLAGSHVTDEARAAADSLLGRSLNR